ncbi:unnamed protein product [Adineta ricciae]|uniref:Uncharacterized protein n=1 Tax=Adineta ricciae TaxID=249248 RepID=A0A815X7U7_ADIRI|nr:unnamed protein product [Adineta ricciae]
MNQKVQKPETPRGSAELIHEGRAIPLSAKQLNDAPIIGERSFGTVHDIDLRDSSNLHIVAKHIKCFKDENGVLSAVTEMKTMEKLHPCKSPNIVPSTVERVI